MQYSLLVGGSKALAQVEPFITSYIWDFRADAKSRQGLHVISTIVVEQHVLITVWFEEFHFLSPLYHCSQIWFTLAVDYVPFRWELYCLIRLDR